MSATVAGPGSERPVREGPVLEAHGVERTYTRPRRALFEPAPRVHALRGIDLAVQVGERLGIVGESGSGKSTLARLLVALDQPTAGTVAFRGTDLATATAEQLLQLRREVLIVFQDPVSSLDPRLRVRRSLLEPLRALRVPGNHETRVRELLTAVGLGPEAAARYPHEFSGGQRQRIAIARALAPHPQVLVADEPVSALDVSVRAQILNLLLDLSEQLELTLVLVSHDLAVVRHTCDRVVVMRDGLIVEEGPVEAIFSSPQHPYTQALLAAAPRLQAVAR